MASTRGWSDAAHTTTRPIPMLKARYISSIVDVASLLNAREDRRHDPRGSIDARRAPGRKDARQILGDAAAGDMRHPLDQARLNQRTHGGEVRPVRREKRVANGRTKLRDERVRRQPGQVEEHVTRERIAIRVQSGRRQADERVARHDPPAVDDARLLDDTDDEAGDVVFTVGVESRHLGRLAADQRAAVFAAPARDAGNHLLGDVRRQPARSPGSRERTAARRPEPGCR